MEFHTMVHKLNQYGLTKFIQEANKSQEMFELAGSPLDKENPKDPYTIAYDMLAVLIMKAIKGQEHLLELKNHRHRWSENNYCIDCGADGRS